MQCVFFQAEDGIRDLVRSRGLGDVYKRQDPANDFKPTPGPLRAFRRPEGFGIRVDTGFDEGLSLIHI